jgi:putative lipoic acid-binding regulatory protein
MGKSRYQIAFNEHPVHASLKQVGEQRADLPEALIETAQAHDPDEALGRLGGVLDYIGALLGSADSALVTPQMLNNLDGPLQQISSALTPLKDSEDFGQIPTIQNGTEALLSAAIQVAPAIGVWAKGDAKKAASFLGEAATAKTRDLQGQASDLQGKLDRLEEQVREASESVKAASDERISEMQGQLDTLKTEADAERTRVQESIDNFQTQFNSDQEQRVNDFEASKKELSDQVVQVVEDLKETASQASAKDRGRADEVITDLKDRANQILDVLGEKKEEAVALVDLVATSTTAGAFGKEAEAQQEQADTWRRYAIYGGVAGAIVGVAAIVASFFSDPSPSLIIAKIAAVTLLLGIAGYAAGQSGQHRRREQRAKRLYLELVAFGPFAEPLGPEDKLAVRKDFIERLFVGDPGEDHHDRDPRLSDENLSALAKLIDLVRPSGSSS